MSLIDPHREKVDNLIEAKHLKVGNQLHLVFIGGDEYITIKDLFFDGQNKVVIWFASHYAEFEETISFDKKVWIKK